jgi:RNA polymerase sigma factor (sigma-70 family)
MEPNDWNLIRDWQGGAQEAFTELVRRHLPLVLASARRQLPDPHLAEDVAQAVFLLLARKAPSLPPSTVLPGWLFNTTRLVVRHTLRSETRRRQRENLAAAMNPHPTSTPSPDPSWDRASAVLDEALAQMAAADRDALLLRFTEGRNHREVGVALGIGEEAARKRVDRAMERLRVRLAGAGITFATLTLTAFLQDRLSAAPVEGLAQQIAGAAMGDPLANSVVQAVVAAEQKARWMQWGAAAAGVAVCVTGAVAWVGVPGFGADAGSLAEAGRVTAPLASAPAVGAVPDSGSAAVAVSAATLPFPTNAVPFLLRVVAGPDSRPVAGARVVANYVVGSSWIPLSGLQTGADGLCAVPIPAADLGRLDVAADSPGLGTRSFKWVISWGTPRPANYTLRLHPGVAIGGVVLGTNGAPLPNTEVTIAYNNGDAEWHDPELSVERPGFVRSLSAGVTDATGRWAFASIPPDIAAFQIELFHPDHAPTSFHVQPPVPSDRELWSRLGQHRQTNRMEVGHALAGIVVDGQGRPLPGVHVSNQDYLTNGVTGADGSFLLRPIRPELFKVSLWARGYAIQSVRMTPDQPPQRIVMQRAGRIRARVVTADGSPIAGAHVHLLDTGLDPGVNWAWSSDADGHVEWDSAPPSGGHRFYVSAPGYQTKHEGPLPVSDEESVITLDAAPMAEFLVTDAETGQRIPAFKVIPGARQGGDSDPSVVPHRFDVSASRVGQNGELRMELAELLDPLFQIEAEGYLPVIANPGPPGPDGNARVECRMKPLRDADRIRGRVVDASGRPVRDAEVAMTTMSNFIEVQQGKFWSDQARFIRRTDAEGRFELRPQPDGVWVVAAHASGFARARVGSSGVQELVLQPLGRIAGRYLDLEGRPMVGRQVNLANPVPYAGCPALSSAMFSVRADADGGFVFEGVPPGRWLIHGYPLAPGTTAAVSDFLPISECVEVEPGARVDGIELGRLKPGAVTVRGRFLSPVESPLGDWKMLVNTATLHPIVAKPAPPSGLSVAGQRSWMVDWSETAEAFGIACVERDYPLRVAADGSFEAHGVPPGEYRLLCIVLGGEGTLAVQRDLARRYGLAGGNAAAPKDSDEVDSRPWSASIQTNVVIRAGNGAAGQVVPIGDFQPKIRR